MADPSLDPMQTVLLSIASSSVVAAFVSYALQWFTREGAEERERSSAKQALQAEVEDAAALARGYLKLKTPRSPIWRASNIFFPHAAPKLVSLGALNRTATAALLEYYRNLEALNRSLDAIAQSEGTKGFEDECARGWQKATLLVPAAHLRLLREDLELPDGFKAFLTKRLAAHEERMPYDHVMTALALI